VVQTTRPAEVAQAKPAEAQPQPKKLPQTATELPLLGLIGALMLFSGGVLFVAGRVRIKPAS
jgi:LPXTG-motif cell wall-anchored protein